MKPLHLLLASAVFFVGCVAPSGDLAWEKSGFLDVPHGEDGEVYYFQYPLAAEVVNADGEGSIDYQGCSVKFADHVALNPFEDVDIKDVEIGGKKRESWFRNNMLVLYSAYAQEDFVFWVYQDGKDMAYCMDFVDKIANSFTDRPYYYNDEFSFRIETAEDYKLEHMPSGEGVMMKQWVEHIEEDSEDDSVVGYVVEVSASGSVNTMEYESIVNLVSDKYEGYSVEFLEKASGAGVVVNEGAGDNALKKFFILSENGNYIYEVSLKLPSKFYDQHVATFEAVVESFEEV